MSMLPKELPEGFPEGFPRAFAYACTVKQPSVDDFKLMALLAHSGDCMYRALADLAPHAHDAELLRETAREQVIQAERMRRAVELLLGEAQPPLCPSENPYYRVPEGSFEPHLIKSVAKAEQKSRRTYLTWADAVGREDVAALCRQNAEEEVAHAERLLSILAGFGRAAPLTPSNGVRILFVVTSHDRKGDKPSGYHLSEVTHPHKLLREAGYQIDFVSPAGGKPPIDPDSFLLDDPINAAFWNDPARREAIEHTRRPGEVDARAYAAIVYVGGHGAMWDFPDNLELASLGRAIYERGGVVSAVCHGVAGLLNLRLSDGTLLIAGRQIAAFTDDEERAVLMDTKVPFLLATRLVEQGALHIPGPKWQPNILASERLITGQNPASASGVARSLMAMLEERARATPALS